MTLVGHSLWDTLVGHSCGSLLWDTLTRHCCETLLWDTLVGHSYGTLLWDTLLGHSCGTLLSLTSDMPRLHQHVCPRQRHSATQTHFPPRPRKSAWHSVANAETTRREQDSTPRPPELNENPSLHIQELDNNRANSLPLDLVYRKQTGYFNKPLDLYFTASVQR